MKKLKKLLKKIINKSKNKKLFPLFKLSKPLRIGVVGAGIQATRLTEQVKNAGGEIVAVHDIQIVAAQQLAKLRNAKISTVKLDEFFEVPMDGVLICTIPTVRFEPIIHACNKKLHLLIEKPPAYNLDEGRKCLSAINESGVISSVGFQSRYDPRYEKLKKMIAGHEIHLVRTKITIPSYPPSNETPWA